MEREYITVSPKIKDFLPSKLREEKSDIVVVQAGGNDLSSTTRKDNPVHVRTIANDIIQAGRICAESGAKVCISSVLPRSDFFLQLKRQELNGILRGMCAWNGFNFVENNNIILSKHILPDGVHLNQSGTELFSNNLIDCLNNVSA